MFFDLYCSVSQTMEDEKATKELPYWKTLWAQQKPNLNFKLSRKMTEEKPKCQPLFLLDEPYGNEHRFIISACYLDNL